MGTYPFPPPILLPIGYDASLFPALFASSGTVGLPTLSPEEQAATPFSGTLNISNSVGFTFNWSFAHPYWVPLSRSFQGDLFAFDSSDIRFPAGSLWGYNGTGVCWPKDFRTLYTRPPQIPHSPPCPFLPNIGHFPQFWSPQIPWVPCRGPYAFRIGSRLSIYSALDEVGAPPLRYRPPYTYKIHRPVSGPDIRPLFFMRGLVWYNGTWGKTDPRRSKLALVEPTIQPEKSVFLHSQACLTPPFFWAATNLTPDHSDILNCSSNNSCYLTSCTLPDADTHVLVRTPRYLWIPVTTDGWTQQVTIYHRESQALGLLTLLIASLITFIASAATSIATTLATTPRPEDIEHMARQMAGIFHQQNEVNNLLRGAILNLNQQLALTNE
ncbi:uncharacterized protein LOC141498200 [Macrotis lagotis]|uniref:uncharacterized protein LOC141498200 n=1 Tax=Macrotis lagotis TaxID=92651 RepID=UPI003D68BC62